MDFTSFFEKEKEGVRVTIYGKYGAYIDFIDNEVLESKEQGWKDS